MKVLFKTPLRGFFRHLLQEKSIHAEFQSVTGAMYETQSTLKYIIKSVARSRLFDVLGIIQVPNAIGEDCDIYGSYNRFLRADKPYFICVENPTALYHYCLHRGQSFLGKHHLSTHISDNNLKALVYISKACQSTFEQVCIHVPEACTQRQIYPLVPDNPLVSESTIINRCQAPKTLKLLFVAQGNVFTTKGALEVLEAFRRLRKEGLTDMTLTMITSLSDVPKEALLIAQQQEGCSVYDFKFSFTEMEKIYAEHSILLIPTSQDSSPLTVLEAMKAGLPALASRLYAIPEMIADGENGYLTDPAWWFFDAHNIPNPAVWNHRKETIYSGKRNERITKFLEEKIRLLYANRDLLKQLSLNSYHKAMTPPFSRDYIANQWNELFNKIG